MATETMSSSMQMMFPVKETTLSVLGTCMFERVEAEFAGRTARKVRWQSGFPLAMSCHTVSAKTSSPCSIAVTRPAALILMGKWRE